MIRLLYGLAVLTEVVLLLGLLLLFIVTDSRTIKYIADTSLQASKLHYESIEGNLFNGLEIKKLTYNQKVLFDSALVHWNPLSLFSHKVTITQIDAKGIELKNVLSMANDLSSRKSKHDFALDFSLVVNSSHFDINPYVYENVKFSSFVFETGKIELDQNLTLNTGALYLKFDSDLVNVALRGKVTQSKLLIDKLNLKNISAKDITHFKRRIKRKYKKNKALKVSKNKVDISKINMPIKEIKIKHILGTIKAVKYGDLKIKNAKLDLYNGEIDLFNNFEYQVKKVMFKGETNFGSLNYKGYIQKSNIYAKGDIRLDKSLFSKYAVPLDFKNFEKLASTLHLNHDLVSIGIEHKVDKLLSIQNDFNINLEEGKHLFHYDYKTAKLNIDSNLSGSMTYADKFKIENKILIDKKGFSYEGTSSMSKLKMLPPVISNYLLGKVDTTFKGDSQDLELDLDSELLSGHCRIEDYKSARLDLKSKSANIMLNAFVPNVPMAFQNEAMHLDSKIFFNFRDFKQSRIELNSYSQTADINMHMNLEEPYKINFVSKLNNDRAIKEIIPKLHTSELRELRGSLMFDAEHYLIDVENSHLKLFMDYNHASSSIEKGVINIENEEFTFQTNSMNTLEFYSKVDNIQNFLEKIKTYYDIDIPNVQGEVDLHFKRESTGKIFLGIKSPKLQYLSDKGTNLTLTNIYNIDVLLAIDELSQIEIDHYQFKLDDNGYLNSFYSNKKSYLHLKENLLEINELWINEQIKVAGKFNLENLVGDLKVEANRYEFSTKDFNLVLALDLAVKINKEEIDITGDVNIWGDTISYEVMGTDIVEDSDIIILTEMLETKESAFNNLKLYVKIKSEKPLKYIADDINIEFLNNLSIVKNYNQEMLVTGVSTITKGYYQIEDKQFILDTSHLYFTGDIKKPLLDIKASYEKDQYNVHVFISGTTDAPIVNFNSEPFLTQQEILSLILFDGTGSSSGKGAEAYTLLGGTFAKGLIKSLGIDVDHLLLGTDAQEELSLEIGKKISKNISVLYLHKSGLDGAKVRIEHSKSFETDIIIQPPNTSSIEFLYKQDR